MPGWRGSWRDEAGEKRKLGEDSLVRCPSWDSGLGWDAWETRGLDWRELGLIEGREARRIGVPRPQVHLLGEGCPN